MSSESSNKFVIDTDDEFRVEMDRKFDDDGHVYFETQVFRKDPGAIEQIMHSKIGEIIKQGEVMNALQAHGVTEAALDSAVTNALQSALKREFEFKIDDQTTMNLKVDGGRQRGVSVGFTIKF